MEQMDELWYIIYMDMVSIKNQPSAASNITIIQYSHSYTDIWAIMHVQNDNIINVKFHVNRSFSSFLFFLVFLFFFCIFWSLFEIGIQLVIVVVHGYTHSIFMWYLSSFMRT